MWLEQYVTYNSFVTAREKSGRRHFRSYVPADDEAEARVMELSRQTVLEEEHARSLFKAQRQTHEEVNTARAASGSAREACRFDAADAHRRRVEDAFCRADEAHELERRHRESDRKSVV